MNRTVRPNDIMLDRLAEKIDILLAKTSTIEGKLEGLPNRVQVLETAVTRIDTTLSTLVGTVTRNGIDTDKLEERLRLVEGKGSQAEGALWMSGKFWAGLTGAGSIGALLGWFLKQ